LNIRSVVHESLKLIRSSTPTNIEIRQDLSLDVLTVLGNATQINQLLINLCTNSVDAMPSKGGLLTVTLSSEVIKGIRQGSHGSLKPGHYVKLMISDNGSGMDKKILNRVFEPYYTTKDIGKGSGIGLSVVHGIVEEHGGAITVDSHPGEGTTFTLFLPIHAGQLEDARSEENFQPVGNERILYVDDEPAIAKLGKRHLENLGYSVESTTDPLQALRMVKANPDNFDLVVSDMAMPQMTGDELITEVLKIRNEIKTIICTGFSTKISEKEAREIGATSFVMKPFNKAELAQAIRQALDGK
jgi:CheY-like chemotaxis protein